MSEDERPRVAAQDEQADDVEAHKARIAATDEGTEEDSEDFEAHRARTNIPKKA